MEPQFSTAPLDMEAFGYDDFGGDVSSFGQIFMGPSDESTLGLQ